MFLSQNYFIGKNRMRLTFRKIDESEEASILEKQRVGQSFSSESASPQYNEWYGTFTDDRSGTRYRYF